MCIGNVHVNWWASLVVANLFLENRLTQMRPPQCTHNEPALQHYMDTTNKIMYYIVYYIVPEELSMPTMVDGPVAFII